MRKELEDKLLKVRKEATKNSEKAQNLAMQTQKKVEEAEESM